MKALLLVPLVLGLSSQAFSLEARNKDTGGFGVEKTLLITSEDYVPKTVEEYFRRAQSKERIREQ